MDEDVMNEAIDGEDRISCIGSVGDTQKGIGDPPAHDIDVVRTTAGSGLPPVAAGSDRPPHLKQVAQAREDWADPSLSDWHARALFELTPNERQVVENAWVDRAAQAYHHLGKLSRLTTWLLNWSAPWEVIVRAQRAALEATRSTEELFGVATSLAGRPLGPGPFTAELGAPNLDASLVRLLVEEATTHHAAACAALMGGSEAFDEEIAELLQRVARQEGRAGDLYLRTVEWVLGVQPETRRSLVSSLESPPAASRQRTTSTDELLLRYGIAPEGSAYERAYRKTIEPRILALLSPPLAAALRWKAGA